jgi:hypothetical protein
MHNVKYLLGFNNNVKKIMHNQKKKLQLLFPVAYIAARENEAV